MKHFSDLLATDSWLEIEIQTAQGQMSLRWPLLVPIDLSVHDPVSVCIDGMQVVDYGYHDRGHWRITLHEPFYRWRHRVTGQGWLLEPARKPQD